MADNKTDGIDLPSPIVIRAEISDDGAIAFTFEAIGIDGAVYAAHIPHKAIYGGEGAVRATFAKHAEALRADAERTLRAADAYDELARRPVVLPDLIGGEGWPL